MVIVSGFLLDIFTLRNKQVTAMALWPFIIFRDQPSRNNVQMLNHERIHHRQQLELLIVPFYIWYFIEYWTAMFRCGFKHHKAYMSISFEQEAYAHQWDLNYLNKRKWLGSWPYFKAKFKQDDHSKKNNQG